MGHSRIRHRLLFTFLGVSLVLGVPLVLTLFVLGALVPRAGIGGLTQVVAAQIADRVTVEDVAILREEASAEAESRFSDLAREIRDAILSRTRDPWLRDVLRERVVAGVELIVSTGPMEGRVVAALDPALIGEHYDFNRFEEIDPQLEFTVIDDDDAYGEQRRSTFAPVRGMDGTTIAMVEVRSDGTFQHWLDIMVGVLALVVFASAALISAASARLLGRRIHEPVELLHAGMRRLASGDLGVTLPSLNTRDEFDDLIGDFNQMGEQLRERAALRRSMALAAEIQTRLLPKGSPILPRMKLAAEIRWAEHTGGDYYDFIEIPGSPNGNARWLIVVGDVAGHGLSAALLVTWCRAAVRTLAREQPNDLPGLLKRLNHSLLLDAYAGRFVTLFLALVDPDQPGVIEWISAGHEPARLLHTVQSRLERLAACGPPIGVVDSATWYSPEPLHMACDDLLVLLTDGASDARTASGTPLGEEGLDVLLTRTASTDAPDFCQNLLTAITSHAEGTLPDDVTIVALRMDDDAQVSSLK